MAQGDIVRASWVGNLNQQRVMFGWHLRFLTSSATMDGAAADMQTGLLAGLLAAISSGVTLTEILVQDVRSDGPESVHHALPGGSVGTVAGDALPGQCAAVVSLHTGQKGRRRRGRYYVPGLSEGNAAAGRLSGTQLAAIQAFAANASARYAVSGTSADYRMVIHSPQDLTAVPPRPGDINTDVTSSIVDDIIRTQRRRVIGVGQ